MGQWSISSPTGGNTASVDNNGTVNVTANPDNKTHTYIVKYTENGHCGTYEFTQQAGSGPGPQPGERTVNIELHNNYGEDVRIGGIYFYVIPIPSVPQSGIVGHCGIGQNEGLDITIPNGSYYTFENVRYGGCIELDNWGSNTAYWQNAPTNDKACKVYTWPSPPHDSENYLVDPIEGELINGETYVFYIKQKN